MYKNVNIYIKNNKLLKTSKVWKKARYNSFRNKCLVVLFLIHIYIYIYIYIYHVQKCQHIYQKQQTVEDFEGLEESKI